MTTILLGITPKCEVFCLTCGQLRLWCREESPQECGNCGSDLIETGPINGPKLAEMRRKWRKTER